MATTALEIKTNSVTQRLLFMTVDAGDGVMHVDIYKADENFLPEGTPSIGVSEHASEEDYHKSLRGFAEEQGQFIADSSTNPEWNPSYVEGSLKIIDEDYDQVQGDLYQ